MTKPPVHTKADFFNTWEAYRHPFTFWLIVSTIALCCSLNDQFQLQKEHFLSSEKAQQQLQTSISMNEATLESLTAISASTTDNEATTFPGLIEPLISPHSQIAAVIQFAPQLNNGSKQIPPVSLIYSKQGTLSELSKRQVYSVNHIRDLFNTPSPPRLQRSKLFPLNHDNYYLLMSNPDRSLPAIALLIAPSKMAPVVADETTILLQTNLLTGVQYPLFTYRNHRENHSSFWHYTIQQRRPLTNSGTPMAIERNGEIPVFVISTYTWILFILGSLLYFYLISSQIQREKSANRERQLSNKRLLLQSKNRRQMLKAISHDFRTPLTRLQLRVTTLLRGETKDKSLSDIKEVENLIESSLNYLRGEEQQELPEKTSIHALIHSLQQTMAERGKHFTIHGEIGKHCHCQPIHIQRALQQLLDNAFQYSDQVVVELYEQSDALTVKILDNGPGINEQLLSQVTEPYFRVDASRNRKTGGIGLGLAIVSQTCEAHDGALQLSNRPQGGICASIKLPYSV